MSVIRDIDHIKAALEQWARWVHGGTAYGISMTGKLMGGVKSNICPKWLDDVAMRKAHDPYCQLCQGKGRIKLNSTRTSVNPATIHGTGISYGDVTSSLIDKLVSEWMEKDETVWLSLVIKSEYCRNGTQPMKSEKLKVSLSFYEKRLRTAHVLVGRMLDEKLPKSAAKSVV